MADILIIKQTDNEVISHQIVEDSYGDRAQQQNIADGVIEQWNPGSQVDDFALCGVDEWTSAYQAVLDASADFKVAINIYEKQNIPAGSTGYPPDGLTLDDLAATDKVVVYTPPA